MAGGEAGDGDDRGAADGMGRRPGTRRRLRWWVRSRALELGLAGFAENLADGRVKVVAEGAGGRCRDLLALLADGTVAET